MKITQVERELLKTVKAPGENLEKVLQKVNSQEKQKVDKNLSNSIDIDPSIYRHKGGKHEN